MSTVVYYIVLICVRVLSLIPRRIGFVAGKTLGNIAYLLSRRYRKVALNNLQRALPNEPEKKKIAKEAFMNLGILVTDFIYFYNAGPKTLRRFVKISGTSHYQRAKEKGQGVLLLAAHLGNWELLGITLAGLISPIYVVVRPLDFEPLNRVTEYLRTFCGNRLLPKKHSMRSLLQALNQGEAVGILLDQKVNWKSGVYVEFFDQPTFANKGMALVALKTGVPVVPVFMVRQKDNTYQLIFEPELQLIRTGDKTKDIEKNTALFTKIIEHYVRTYPGQWLWMHNRWRKKPYEPWSPKRPKKSL